MITIAKLYPKACRGVLDGPVLRIETGGMLLCGSNGTGKSSYVDALEKVITGVCSSLDTGDQGLSWGKQGTHLRSTSGPEVELTLKDGSKDIVVSLATGQDGLPKNIRAWFAAGCKQSFLLRRRSMLRFIDAKPAERYKAVDSFLNLREFARFEAQLKVIVDQLDAAVTTDRAQASQLEPLIRRQLMLDNMAKLSDVVCLEGASKIFTAAGLSPAAADTDIETRARAVDTQLDSFGDVERLTRQRGLLQLCIDLPGLEGVLSAAHELHDALAGRDAIARSIEGAFHSEVLEGALSWLNADAIDQCPVCESTIDRALVEERIRVRLQDNAQFTAAQRRTLIARSTVVRALESWLASADSLRSAWTAILDESQPRELEEVITHVQGALLTYRGGDELESLRTTSAGIAEIDLSAIREGLANAVKGRVGAIPNQEKYHRLLAAKAAAHAYLTHWSTLRDLHAKSNIKEQSLSEARRVVSLAEQARKQTVQSIMDGVADLADAYYQKIHPGEKIGSPKLKVTDRGTGSLTLESGFHGLREDPRGRYSEGHIDSLGLCLFLAIRRLHHRQDPTFSVLVLDDVLHSVDGAHRRETANLIFEEFADHQVIVTTHDPLWFENLKLAASRKGRRFARYRFSGWSLSAGPILGDHQSDFEWLTSPSSTKATAADRVIKAGRLLEESLQNACDALVIAVPFRIRGDYTIDPLWKGFRSRAKENKEFWKSAETTVESVEALRQLRNWVGAHWNAWAQHLTESEADAFTQCVIKLRELLYCEECDQFVCRIAQLDGVWACKGEHLRYSQKPAP